MKESLQGFLFWIFRIFFSPRERDGRKFSEILFQAFQVFLFCKSERWTTFFRACFLFFQSSFFWRGERWTIVFRGFFRVLPVIGDRYRPEVLGFSNYNISGFIVYCTSKF
jgi:hypothetical protein